jgi:hypothetical protein
MKPDHTFEVRPDLIRPPSDRAYTVDTRDAYRSYRAKWWLAGAALAVGLIATVPVYYLGHHFFVDRDRQANAPSIPLIRFMGHITAKTAPRVSVGDREIKPSYVNIPGFAVLENTREERTSNCIYTVRTYLFYSDRDLAEKATREKCAPAATNIRGTNWTVRLETHENHDHPSLADSSLFHTASPVPLNITLPTKRSAAVQVWSSSDTNSSDNQFRLTPLFWKVRDE